MDFSFHFIPTIDLSGGCRLIKSMAAMSAVLATSPNGIVAPDSTPSGLSNPFKPSLRVSQPIPKLGTSKLVMQVTAKQSSEEPTLSTNGRRAAILCLASALLSTAGLSGSANAGLVDDLLAKSAANKELNDKKRLATSEANLARAYTVEFGTCKFPYNFTGCHDLAKTKYVPFLTEDLKLECEGKDKFKCGSNVFWKWTK